MPVRDIRSKICSGYPQWISAKGHLTEGTDLSGAFREGRRARRKSMVCMKEREFDNAGIHNN